MVILTNEALLRAFRTPRVEMSSPRGTKIAKASRCARFIEDALDPTLRAATASSQEPNTVLYSNPRIFGPAGVTEWGPMHV